MGEKKCEILIVDDEDLNCMILQDFLGDEYVVDVAYDGDEAIGKIYEKSTSYELVLLDLKMPKCDGMVVLRALVRDSIIDKLPVIILTSENSIEVENECLKMGVADFIRKPFEPSIVKNRVQNVIDLFRYHNNLEKRVEEQTNALKRKNRLLQKQAEYLRETNRKILDILGNVVECRDLESGEHINRVRSFTEILARRVMKEYPEYGLTERALNTIVNASPLHDIGKIAIPDSILLKPGKLTAEEFEIMKTHTIKGCELLDKIQGVLNDEYWNVCYEICRYHHEKYDGNGYPDNLSGEDIPLSAQLVSIADVYDALVSKRIYKSPYGKEEAFNIIIEGGCGEFSTKLMDCFVKSKKEFEKVVDTDNYII